MEQVISVRDGERAVGACAGGDKALPRARAVCGRTGSSSKRVFFTHHTTYIHIVVMFCYDAKNMAQISCRFDGRCRYCGFENLVPLLDFISLCVRLVFDRIDTLQFCLQFLTAHLKLSKL